MRLSDPIADVQYDEAVPFVWEEPPTTIEIISDLLAIAVQAQLDEPSDDASATCDHFGIDPDVASRLYSTLAGHVAHAMQHAIETWSENAEQIEEGAGKARRIANEWHGGQGSALCSFMSTGAVVDGALAEEIRYELLHADVDVHGEQAIDDLTWLAEYVSMIPLRGPMRGWSDFWEI